MTMTENTRVRLESGDITYVSGMTPDMVRTMLEVKEENGDDSVCVVDKDGKNHAEVFLREITEVI